MGYETKLIIGKSSTPNVEYKQHKNLRLESDKQSVYRPVIRRNDELVPTGRNQTYFSVYATLDLCKCGYDSHVSRLDRVNLDKNNYVYFYEGNVEVMVDNYGDYMKPVPINEVVEALRKDVMNSKYRRYNWALSLLESMQSDSENIEVLLFGH